MPQNIYLWYHSNVLFKINALRINCHVQNFQNLSSQKNDYYLTSVFICDHYYLIIAHLSNGLITLILVFYYDKNLS